MQLVSPRFSHAYVCFVHMTWYTRLLGFFGFTATSGSPYRSVGSFVTLTCVGCNAKGTRADVSDGDGFDVDELAVFDELYPATTAATATAASSFHVIRRMDLSLIDRIPGGRRRRAPV